MTAQEELDRLRQKIADGTMSPDEPLFVLRAQDSLAPSIVLMWASSAKMAGAPKEKVEEAVGLSHRMAEWTGSKKIPD